MRKVKYPNVTVPLTGEDSNAFEMIARTSRALKRAGVEESLRYEFRSEAASGDYNHVLKTITSWVNTE